jgi:Porin PorA
MRRVVGLVASALGTFLIVLALLTRFYVAGEAIKFPLNESAVSTLTASNASYFSASALQERTGVNLTDTTTVQGDVASSNSSRAVWNEFTYLYDSTNHQAFDYSLSRLAFDRRTAALQNCCGAAIGTDTKLTFSGLGYVWPLGSQKTTYQVFDMTLLKPMPTRYVGTAVVDGENTYKFVEQVPPTKSGTETLPGSLVGVKGQQTVQLDEYYQGTTTDWVDPATGAPVKVSTDQHLYLVNSAGTQVLNLLNADFNTTPATVSSAVSTANSDDAKISLVSVILPVIFGLLGIILLIIGLIIAWPRAQYDYEDELAGDFEGGEVPA